MAFGFWLTADSLLLAKYNGLRFYSQGNFWANPRNSHNFHTLDQLNPLLFINEETGFAEPQEGRDFKGYKSIHNKPDWRVELGMGWHPLSNLTVAMDLFSDIGYGFGYEWQPFKNLFIRQGMNHKYDLLYKNESIFGLSWGCGFKYDFARFDISYYFPYGGRNGVDETTPLGGVRVNPSKNDLLFFSASFSLK